jgi:hypothetical protein
MVHISLPPAGEVAVVQPMSTVARLVVGASVAASAYHGYRRNRSVGWAIWWAAMGGLFPIVTPAIALAQGFGQPERGLARRT